MKQLLIVFLGGIILGVVGFARNGMACACCADPGWKHYLHQLDYYESDELLRLKFLDGFLREEAEGKEPHFIVGGGLVEKIAAYRLTIKENLPHQVVFSAFPLDLSLKHFSTLKFHYRAETEMTSYDDGRRPAGTEVLLDKILAIKGELHVEGTLNKLMGLEKIPARLILIGRGNNCFAAEDFEKWELEFNTEINTTDAPTTKKAKGKKLSLRFRARGSLEALASR